MALDVVQQIANNREWREQIIEAARREGAPLTMQALNEWRRLKKGVPPSRAQLVARVTGLSLHDIRPDIFPPGG